MTGTLHLEYLTLRGMVSSQSGKLITLAALPTHSTITVANICTEIHEEISVDTCLVLRCGVSLVNVKEEVTRITYLSYSDTYRRREPEKVDETPVNFNALEVQHTVVSKLTSYLTLKG